MSSHCVGNDAFEALGTIQNCHSVGEVYQAFGTYISQFGFKAFLITDMPPTGFNLEPHVLLNGWPMEWFDLYMAKQYYDHDPIALRSQTTAKPFFWNDALAQTELTVCARQVIVEAAEFGLKAGLSVPVYRGDGMLSCVTMGGDQLDLPPRAKDALHLVSFYAYDKARLFQHEKLCIVPRATKALLTKREQEILSWVAQGKTDHEIAIICDISPNTSHQHVRRAMAKLDAVTRAQATAKALLAGEIKL